MYAQPGGPLPVNAAGSPTGPSAGSPTAPFAGSPAGPSAGSPTRLSSPAPAWSHFEHDADFGVVGWGATVEQAFENAALATFAICAGGGASAGADAVDAGIEAVAVDFVEPDVELALVTWLNALISESAARRLRLSEFRLTRDGGRWVGTACGRGWRQDEERGTEVKGATLTMLSVRPRDGGWEARCVVDV